MDDANVPQYTILLPTYNEIENLPICIWLIEKYMTEAKLNYEVLFYLLLLINV